MSRLGVIDVHEIATDGLPDMKALVGRVAFIFDGCIISGWPLTPEERAEYSPAFISAVVGVLWEADSDVGGGGRLFSDVTHWVEFPIPVAELAR